MPSVRNLLLQRRRLLLRAAYLLISRRKRIWVRDFFKKREILGERNMILELREDTEKFFSYFRMSPQQFDELLTLVAPKITKKHTNWRAAISAETRLAITLRFLATGCSCSSLSRIFRVGDSTVCGIIEDTCGAIWDVLQPKLLKFPASPEEWKNIAKGYEDKWNFPMCVGTIDGKRITTQGPYNNGSEHTNYKGHHNIVLLAMCDANYCFTMVTVCDLGSHIDSDVLSSSDLGELIFENKLNFPPDELLPGSEETVPYCIVGDVAFPFHPTLMRPYPEKSLSGNENVFNYRLSRAHRAIENAFGIFAARWRVFVGTITANSDKVILMCKAACCLHNFLQKKAATEDPGQNMYCPDGFLDYEDAQGNVVPGDWRKECDVIQRPLVCTWDKADSKLAEEIRERYTRFFTSPEGELSWQLAAIEK